MDDRLLDTVTTSARKSGLSPTLLREIAAASHFILDLDGTLLSGRHLAPGAKELLEQIQGRFVILSNNSTDIAASLARSLRGLGVAIEPRRIILAGEQTVRFVAEKYPGARVVMFGSPVLLRFARKLGVTLVKGSADVVVLARDRRFDYESLTLAANELRRGAKLVVTNPDLHHPGDDGTVVPETGTLLRALTACSGTGPGYVIGKPQSAMFVEALQRLKADPTETLMIGDNPATDELGARALGMHFLLIGEGGFLKTEPPSRADKHHAANSF